jgi:mercuric ion binding protein
MQGIRYILAVSVVFFSFQLAPNEIKPVKDSFSVKGNCLMCKTTIENSVKSLKGISSFKWNPTKQLVIVKFDPEVITLAEIQKAVASSGYDTPIFKATDEDYDNLHHCCQYDR